MKCLSDYTQEKQTALFAETGAFFAFGQKQFKEQSKPGVKYVSLSCGAIVPCDSKKALLAGLEWIQKQAIEQDIEENGIDAIIQRELANYECQITMSYHDALDALEQYGISEEQVEAGYKVFFQHCIDNDWFLIMEARKVIEKDNKKITLVVQLHKTLNNKNDFFIFAIVNDLITGERYSLYQNKDKSLNGLSVEEYKNSKERGLFSVVSYADIMPCINELK